MLAPFNTAFCVYLGGRMRNPNVLSQPACEAKSRRTLSIVSR